MKNIKNDYSRKMEKLLLSFNHLDLESLWNSFLNPKENKNVMAFSMMGFNCRNDIELYHEKVNIINKYLFFKIK